MKKNGFTLIELLAVILILGIIALIAIPTVNGVINQSRQGAAESSARALIKAVEEDAIVVEINGNYLTNGKYDVDDLSNLNLEIKGDEPDSGFVIVNDNSVVACNLWYGNNNVVCGYDNDDVKVFEGDSASWIKAENDTYIAKVYYNPNTNSKCTAEEFSENLASYSGTNLDSNGDKAQTGLKDGCMIWYAYKDNGDGTVDMILNHNTTEKTAAASSNSDTSLNILYDVLSNDTSDWQVSVKLPNLDDIFKAIKADKSGYSSKMDAFSDAVGENPNYLDLAKYDISYSTDLYKYDWLLENLYDYKDMYTDKVYNAYVHDSNNNMYGYWTDTKAVNQNASKFIEYNMAWCLGISDEFYVSSNRYLTMMKPDVIGPAITSGNKSGIRPVVTVNRSIFE